MRKMKRAVAGVLAAALMLSVAAGCSSTQSASTSSATNVYVGHSQGFGGEVTANVTVDESGKVVGLEVSAEDETPTVGGQAVEPMTKAILDAGGIDGVDGVTGATITSTAILNAVKDALTQAGVLDASSGEISYTAGTYTGEANGRAGVVTVNVTVNDKEILSIDVTENPDTAGISDRAVEQIPDSIIQSQSLGVDAVAGATMTSRGIINAVADALGKSGVDLDALRAVPVNYEPMATDDLTTNVVVVGGGMAGMISALAAAEKGADVILIDKMSFLGGNLLLAGGGLGTVGAETVDENDDLQRTLDYFKEVNETSERQPDYDFIEKMLPETGRAIDWLTNDFGLEHTSTDCGDYVRTNFGGNGAVFTDSLTKLLEKEGVTVLLNTKGEHILMEDGKAAGMEVSNRSGSYKIYADKVIVATGGASHDWDRMVEANPELETIDFYDEAAVSSTGDGFNMMEEIGAQMDVGPYIKSAYPDVSPVFAYTYANSPTQQNELVVNADGERVANESPYNQMYFNKQMLRQASSAYYAIFDESKMADYFLSDVQKLVERDDNTIVVKADTLEELAKKMDVDADTLRATFDHYQEMCKNGVDDAFGKDASHLIAYEDGPLYAVRVYPASWGTIGGCVTNDNFQVLNENGDVIDNLFAVGEMSTARLFGDYYFGGFSLGFYTAAGHIAAETAVAELGL